jgi:hypothetical protein
MHGHVIDSVQYTWYVNNFTLPRTSSNGVLGIELANHWALGHTLRTKSARYTSALNIIALTILLMLVSCQIYLHHVFALLQRTLQPNRTAGNGDRVLN